MKSIRVKLWAGMMALVIIMLILLGFFQIIFLEKFYTQMRVGDIKVKALAISKLIPEDKIEEFREQMDALAYANNMSIELYDTAGTSIYETYTSGNQMPMLRNNTRMQLYEKALAGQETAVTLTHPRFGNKFMQIGLPLNFDNNLFGVLIINVPLAPVEETASILQRQLGYISFILLVAAIAISFLLARNFTRPVVEIKKAAEKMAGGDFSARIQVKQEDEIGQLAQTVNYLGQQLSQIEQLRKDLIANVSHELRTPLSLIRGYAETLRDVTGNVPDKRDKQLGIIIEETERLSRIVDDILNLSQLQAGHFELKLSCFKVNDLIGRVIKRYDLLSQQTGVPITLQLAGDTLVEADEGRLEQVLYNLINNAYNHIAAGDMLTIRTVDFTDKIRIEVTNSGSGIPEEEITHIWDRFYKAEKSTAHKVGTGLGLAIVKALLEAHGANFGVKSQRDTATTFWFELKKNYFS